MSVFGFDPSIQKFNDFRDEMMGGLEGKYRRSPQTYVEMLTALRDDYKCISVEVLRRHFQNTEIQKGAWMQECDGTSCQIHNRQCLQSQHTVGGDLVQQTYGLQRLFQQQVRQYQVA